MRSGVNEDHAIEQIIDHLQTRYAAAHTDEHVAETVHSAYDGFQDQPVRDFIPLLVERQACDRLDAEDRNPDD